MQGKEDIDDEGLADVALRASEGYSGSWPTLSIWHGAQDKSVVVSNAAAIRRQWSRIHGIAGEVFRTEAHARWVRRIWSDGGGRDIIEEWIIDAMDHGVPVDHACDDRLGAAGPFMLDVGVSSTAMIASTWGLMQP